MFKFLLNRNFIFSISFIAGLVFGVRTRPLSFLNLPLLMIIMTLSFTETDFSAFKDLKKSAAPFSAGIFLNYFFIFALLVILGRLFNLSGDLWAGLVLTAATPPGLAIMPFASIVGGNMFFATAATLSAFAATLAFTPVLTSVFMPQNSIGYAAILRMLFLLIIIPLAAGRLLRVMGLKSFALKIHGPVVNIGFGVIFAVIFGINRNFLFNSPRHILTLLIISAVAVWGGVFIIKEVLKNKKISDDTKKSILLVGTIKNSIFGATAGLALLGPEGALPGTVLTFVTLVYLMFAEKVVRFKFSEEAV